MECASVYEKKYRSAHWRELGRLVGEEPEARLTERRKATEEWRMELEPKKESVALRWEQEHERVEKKSEMETWLVMRLVRILKPEREPRWLTLQRTERVRVSEKCGWVGFSNFYFYSLISFSLISLIEIYLV